MKRVIISVVCVSVATWAAVWFVVSAPNDEAGGIRALSLLFFFIAAGAASFVNASQALMRLHDDLRHQLTTVGKSATHVSTLIAQSEALIEANRVSWERYAAAAEDAERQRVRFLETSARERAANESRPDSESDG